MGVEKERAKYYFAAENEKVRAYDCARFSAAKNEGFRLLLIEKGEKKNTYS